MRASSTDSQFHATLRSWFERAREILILFRTRYGAGAKEFQLFTSYDEFVERLGSASAGTSIIAFREPQLPIRGVVDDSLIERCLASIPDGSEYLVVETVLTKAGRSSWFHYDAGTSHAVLRGDLESSRGKPVAVGIYPPALEEGSHVLEAIVPDVDGIVRAGPY